MIIPLNLPPPSEDLMSEIMKVVDGSSFDHELKRQMDHIQDYTVNSISHTFNISDEVVTLTQKEFRPYFKNEIFIPSVGVLTNPTPDEKMSSFPPHADRTRIFALNFYIKEGGKHVTTVHYDKFHNLDAGVGTGKMYKYPELTVASITHCKMQRWYALNVRQVHSVEDIENVRLIYTLSFHEMNIHNFLNKYSHYVQIENIG